MFFSDLHFYCKWQKVMLKYFQLLENETIQTKPLMSSLETEENRANTGNIYLHNISLLCLFSKYMNFQNKTRFFWSAWKQSIVGDVLLNVCDKFHVWYNVKEIDKLSEEKLWFEDFLKFDKQNKNNLQLPPLHWLILILFW